MFYVNSTWSLYSIVYIHLHKQTNKQINTTSIPPPAPLRLHIKLTTQKIHRVHSVPSNRPLGIVFTHLWPSLRNSLLLTGLATPSSDNCCINNIFFLQVLLGSHSYLYTNPPLSINPPKTLGPTILLWTKWKPLSCPFTTYFCQKLELFQPAQTGSSSPPVLVWLKF